MKKNNYNHFLTCSNKTKNNNNNSCKDSYIRGKIIKDNKNKIMPKLQLKSEETTKNINDYCYKKNTFVTLYSRNKNIFNYNNRALTTTYTNNNPLKISNKCFTPKIIRRKNKLKNTFNVNNKKRNSQIHFFSQSSRKIKQYDFDKIINKINKK